jgi:polysaccharide chain length determinant protein (PEP-CTERM system associated)
MLGHRSLNVEDYLGILKRRWWLIAIPAVVFAIVAYSVTYFIQPRYQSQTLVLIEQQQVPSEFVKSVVSEDLNSRLASMKEQILSRSSIQPIIEKYNLYADQKLSMDGRIDLARASIGINLIQSDISRSGGLPGFYISFEANDAHTAQLVCGEIRSLFVKQNLLSREATVKDTTQFLQSQLDEAKRTLDDQDAKLAAFQRTNYGRLPSDESNNVNLLGTLKSQLDSETQSIQTLEQNRSVMEALLAQQAPASTTSSGAVAQTPQVQQKELEDLEARETNLLTHDTPEHPDVKAVERQIADLRAKMAKAASAPAPAAPATSAPSRTDSIATQSIRAQLAGNYLQIQNKNKEKDQTEAQIRMYESRVESTPQVQEEEKQLTRDTQTSQANYDQLSVKLTQSKMANDLEQRQQGETFKVVDDPNLPDSPTYPKKSVFASGGFAAGLALGLLFSALLEYKDTVLRSERDVWAFTQLPTLAVIAWSGEVAHAAPAKMGRLKRPFNRKEPKDTLADATG